MQKTHFEKLYSSFDVDDYLGLYLFTFKLKMVCVVVMMQ